MIFHIIDDYDCQDIRNTSGYCRKNDSQRGCPHMQYSVCYSKNTKLINEIHQKNQIIIDDQNASPSNCIFIFTHYTDSLMRFLSKKHRINMKYFDMKCLFYRWLVGGKVHSCKRIALISSPFLIPCKKTPWISIDIHGVSDITYVSFILYYK